MHDLMHQWTESVLPISNLAWPKPYKRGNQLTASSAGHEDSCCTCTNWKCCMVACPFLSWRWPPGCCCFHLLLSSSLGLSFSWWAKFAKPKLSSWLLKKLNWREAQIYFVSNSSSLKIKLCNLDCNQLTTDSSFTLVSSDYNMMDRIWRKDWLSKPSRNLVAKIWHINNFY